MSVRCENILAGLATGGPFRQWRAQRHAAHCHRCAAALDDLQRIAAELAEVSPLTAAERRLWTMAAVDESAEESSRTRWLRPAVAGALAAGIAVAVGLWWISRPADSRPNRPLITQSVPVPVGPGPLRDMEDLRGGLVALTQELDDLQRRADLLDARRDVDALMARLAPRNSAADL